MNLVLLDASFAIALALKDDPKHRDAMALNDVIFENKWRLLVSSFVMDEVVTLLNSCGQHKKAVAIGNDFLTESIFEFIHVDQALFIEAWALFRRRSDKGWSFTDCVSFELMKKRGVTKALTFDRHFSQAGFTMVPGPK